MNENLSRKDHLCEYLSEDILDEEFIKIFSHYLTVLKVLGASRVDARDRFVSAPTTPQKCYTILLVSLAIALYFISSYFIKGNSFEMNLLLTVSGFQSVSYFVVTILHARFVNNEENVTLYIKMQRIDRLFGIKRHVFLSHHLRLINGIFLLFPALLFFISLTAACIDGTKTTLLFFRHAVFPFICFLDITYFSNLVLFFFFRMRYINSVILNHIKGKPMRKQLCFELSLRQTMRQMAAESHDFRTCELDVYLEELLECFCDFRILHQLPIALYIVNFFFYILLSTQYIILKFRSTELDVIAKYLVPIFITSSILQLFLLCVRFDLFFREVKEIKHSVVTVMSYNFEGPLHEKAKRMWKLLRQVPAGFLVYGVWQIDAVFLIHFFNVSSTMLFTLLQFAHL